MLVAHIVPLVYSKQFFGESTMQKEMVRDWLASHPALSNDEKAKAHLLLEVGCEPCKVLLMCMMLPDARLCATFMQEDFEGLVAKLDDMDFAAAVAQSDPEFLDMEVIKILVAQDTLDGEPIGSFFLDDEEIRGAVEDGEIHESSPLKAPEHRPEPDVYKRADILRG